MTFLRDFGLALKLNLVLPWSMCHSVPVRGISCFFLIIIIIILSLFFKNGQLYMFTLDHGFSLLPPYHGGLAALLGDLPDTAVDPVHAALNKLPLK